jgi:hypothetical protein
MIELRWRLTYLLLRLSARVCPTCRLIRTGGIFDRATCMLHDQAMRRMRKCG